jgi:glycine/D-amino acid oxidase-like deaminating enzyme
MQTAEVVIIGGGIVGSSIAYHLTAAGCSDVLRQRNLISNSAVKRFP